MADTTALKNRIRAAIKANDNQEITGPVLQQALLDMVDELNGATETEASARQSGDSTLQQGINTERQARIDADNVLGQRITEESNARQNGDSTLRQGINQIQLDISRKLHITDDNIWKYTGKYINLSGGLSNHPDFKYTDFLSVELFKNVVSSSISLYSIAGSYEVAYYETNDESTFISGQGNGEGGQYVTELVIPNNAKFLRLCKDKNRANQSINVVPEIQKNVNILYNEVENFNDLDLLDTASAQQGLNAINLTLRKNNGSVGNPNWKILCNILLSAVTNQKAGLMTPAMMKLLYDIRNAGYAFGGVAVTSTNPGVPKSNCFYIVRGAGTYTYFKNADNDSIVLENDGIYVLTYEAVENNYWEYNLIISIDDELIKNSKNVITSGAVEKALKDYVIYVFGDYFVTLENNGKYIRAQYGNLVNDPPHNWLTSDYIEIFNNKTSSPLQYSFVGDGINGISFYSEKNESSYISGVAGNSDTSLKTGTVAIPLNAKYVRFCTRRVTDLFSQCYFKVNIINKIVEDSYQELNSRILELDSEILELGADRTNLFSEVNISGYISSNGSIVSDNNWKHSDYISVTPDTILSGVLIGFPSNAVSVIEFSDENHEIISNETVSGGGNYIYKTSLGYDRILTICKKVPSNAAFIRLCASVAHPAYTNYQCLYVKTSGFGVAINEIWTRLTNLLSNVSNINSELRITDDNIWKYTGKYINLSGGLTNHPDFKYTDFLSVELFKNVISSSISLYSIAGSYEVAYYETNDGSTFISGQGNGEGGQYVTELVIPDNAKFLRLCKDKNRANQSINVVPEIQKNVNILHNNVEKVKEYTKQYVDENKKILNLSGKKIFLYGDSISSTNYTWYKEYMEKYSGATVYNQGLSGGAIGVLAQNDYFNRLATINPDIVICLLGGNDSGGSGTVGTFSENSKLYEMGESVVTETDITQNYNGNKFIQGVSHIIRKWKATYLNFRLSANLSAKLVAASDVSTAIYTGTEKQCIDYAVSHDMEYGTGKDYYILCTESVTEKRNKLMAVPHPKFIMLTTLKQQRLNSAVISSPESWERKRLAVIECCEKYDMPFVDTTRLFNIDMAQEPVFPGMNKTSTDVNDNQGVYTMDGLHPNEFGYEYLSKIILSNISA